MEGGRGGRKMGAKAPPPIFLPRLRTAGGWYAGRCFASGSGSEASLNGRSTLRAAPWLPRPSGRWGPF